MAPRAKPILAALLLLAACGSPEAPKGSLSLKISPGAQKADGSNYFLLVLDGASIGTVTFRTTRGSFEGFGRIVTYTGSELPFTTMLVTCDSRTEPTCAGLALVEATDQSLASARVQVSFQQAP